MHTFDDRCSRRRCWLSARTEPELACSTLVTRARPYIDRCFLRLYSHAAFSHGSEAIQSHAWYRVPGGLHGRDRWRRLAHQGPPGRCQFENSNRLGLRLESVGLLHPGIIWIYRTGLSRYRSPTQYGWGDDWAQTSHTSLVLGNHPSDRRLLHNNLWPTCSGGNSTKRKPIRHGLGCKNGTPTACRGRYCSSYNVQLCHHTGSLQLFLCTSPSCGWH